MLRKICRTDPNKEVINKKQNNNDYSSVELNDIRIEYSGAYPNLCSGQLKVYIDFKDGGTKEFIMPSYCMISGGGVYRDDNWDFTTEHGDWSISEWPDDFPECLKDLVESKVNEEVPPGCCGGCIFYLKN